MASADRFNCSPRMWAFSCNALTSSGDNSSARSTYFSASFGSVSGTFSADQVASERTLFGLDLHVRPELELSLGTFGILVQPALGVSPLRQRYESDDVEVLETQSVWWQLGAGVRVALD